MTEGQDLPERCRPVLAALAAAGMAPEVRRFAASTKTAQLAAEQLGCAVGAIANSLVFDADGTPLLVMASGAHRVDTAALAGRLGRTMISRATPDQVRTATGQVIGGVAPTGHPQPLETVVDVALAEHPVLWASAGTPDTVFRLTYPELVALTRGTELPVA